MADSSDHLAMFPRRDFWDFNEGSEADLNSILQKVLAKVLPFQTFFIAEPLFYYTISILHPLENI